MVSILVVFYNSPTLFLHIISFSESLRKPASRLGYIMEFEFVGNCTFLIPDDYQNCVLEEFSRFELNHDARVKYDRRTRSM